MPPALPLANCWLWLAVGLSLAAPICDAAEDAPLAPSQTRALADFHKSESTAQRRWLEALVSQRLSHAAKIALAPPELAEISAYHEQILARIRDGKAISELGLAKLLRQTASLEARAIERLASDYQRAAAEAFPQDRRQEELRLEAWSSVKTSWLLAGADPELQPRLIDWLSEATRRMTQGQTYRLPARPRFGLLASLVTPREMLTPKFVTGKSSLAERGSSSVDSSSLAVRDSSLATRPTLAMQAEPRLSFAALATFGRPNPLPVGGQLAAVLFAANSATAPAVPPDQFASLPRSSSSLAGPSPIATPLPIATAAPVPRGVTYGIDVAELNDRVAGYKATLGGIKGKLHEKVEWNPARLAALVEELAEIITRRGDLLLYVRLVSDDAGAATALESPGAMVSLASGKISAARKNLEALAGESGDTVKRQELARLSQLSQRLAILVAELQQQDR